MVTPQNSKTKVTDVGSRAEREVMLEWLEAYRLYMTAPIPAHISRITHRNNRLREENTIRIQHVMSVTEWRRKQVKRRVKNYRALIRLGKVKPDAWRQSPELALPAQPRPAP